MKKNIIRNTTIISAGTLLSRGLGLIRDMFFATYFGTTAQANAFVVAFTIPNMLRDILGEGAANAAFVPILSEYKQKDSKKEFWKAANSILLGLFVIVSIVIVIGIWAAPLIIKIMAPGFSKEPAVAQLAITLTRIIFPYILFMSFTAYSMGVLNTLDHFFAPAFCRGLLNIAIIISILLFFPFLGIMCLPIGVLVGGVLQVIVQIPVFKSKGASFAYGADIKHPAVVRSIKLLIPRIAGSTVYQLNIIFDRMFASLFWIVGQGAIAGLYFANRLIQLPIGVFSTAIGTAILPVLSANFVANDMKTLKTNLLFALKIILFVLIPASVGLMVLGKPIINILFSRGAFGGQSAELTYSALFFYAPALFAFGCNRILAFSFYSMNDTLTPVKISAWSLVINIVLNALLMFPLKVGGLALATSIASIFNTICLYVLLKKRIGKIKEISLYTFFMKIMISSVVMGITGFVFSGIFLAGSIGFLTLFVRLMLILILCIIVYIITALLLGLDELKVLKKWILEKK
ncbi:MAG: murein biosynthesis integral membrane protein MurJ [Candidatus Omnitrophica bacterium]|nr:murein biosynthesis integral membrane protein MurJ [Candidatus Omnitrophota bacterium]